ncbi:MAG TPA: hypothetical protein VFM34_00770 [Moraxellaceae bacterium]|nr:hypothetical protein [Moraxellaceae bacterium]
MPSPVESTPFHELATSLHASGQHAHAVRVEEVLNGVWTTSSELIGELGFAVLDVRRGCRPLTAEQRKLIRACLREVRKVWPGFGRWWWRLMLPRAPSQKR